MTLTNTGSSTVTISSDAGERRRPGRLHTWQRQLQQRGGRPREHLLGRRHVHAELGAAPRARQLDITRRRSQLTAERPADRHRRRPEFSLGAGGWRSATWSSVGRAPQPGRVVTNNTDYSATPAEHHARGIEPRPTSRWTRATAARASAAACTAASTSASRRRTPGRRAPPLNMGSQIGLADRNRHPGERERLARQHRVRQPAGGRRLDARRTSRSRTTAPLH